MTAAAALVSAVLAAAPAKMVLIPAGTFHPFLKDTPVDARQPPAPPPPVQVAAFRLDVVPVTARQFAAFVRAHPEWRRSRVPQLFADEQYLADWASDLEPGGEADRPVTFVSWFAARAYCASRGDRLPNVAEWELALADDGRQREAVTRRALDWYQAPSRDPVRVGQSPPNGFGVRDLVGLVWEWTEDFNESMTGDEGRAGEPGLFCGSAGAKAVDPSDYATFMRYAFRSSLKASYAVRGLGFRCAAEVKP